MRVYALLFGILLTTGYGYAADVAVSSLRAATTRASAREGAGAAPRWGDRIFYGGTLAPVTVEAPRSRTAAAPPRLGPAAVRCRPDQPRYRAISFEKVRTSISLAM